MAPARVSLKGFYMFRIFVFPFCPITGTIGSAAARRSLPLTPFTSDATSISSCLRKCGVSLTRPVTLFQSGSCHLFTAILLMLKLMLSGNSYSVSTSSQSSPDLMVLSACTRCTFPFVIVWLLATVPHRILLHVKPAHAFISLGILVGLEHYYCKTI